MSKVVVIYVDWDNTQGNHSGMAYLCRNLKKDIPNLRLIRFYRLEGRGSRIFNSIFSFFYAIYLLHILRMADKVLLMEYLTKSAHQEIIAKILKVTFPGMKLMGMVHLSGKHLVEQHGSDERVLKYLNYIDHVYVMGSSLVAYLKNIGLNENKVIETFHYVDNDYYKPDLPLKVHDKVRVICIGNLKRNFLQLKSIIAGCESVDFDICQGLLDLEYLFGSMAHVKLHGFLPESELMELMQKADISLNVMEDTVGSNVITTSLACGLAMVVSDVGSIRDYCDPKNAIFCRTSHDFISAISNLSKDRSLCLAMKKESLAKAKKYSLKKFKASFEKSIWND